MIRKFWFFSVLFLTLNLSSQKMEITSKYLRAKNLEGVKLFHEGKDFFVEENGDAIKVERAWIDKEVRGISDVQLSYLLGIIKRVEIENKKYNFFIKEVSLEDLAKIKDQKNIPVVTKFENLTEEEKTELKTLFSQSCLSQLIKFFCF